MKSFPVYLVVLLFIGVPPLGAGEKKVPEAPVNLSARGEYEGAVAIAKLSWQDESDNELGFEILRSDNGEDFRVVGFAGANTTRYEQKAGRYVTGAFTYKVRAFNEYGKSEESNPASVWF
ncbi:MAG: hypothetical protein ACE5JX_04935 [Acidobacteriota bacterium]